MRLDLPTGASSKMQRAQKDPRTGRTILTLVPKSNPLLAGINASTKAAKWLIL